MNRSDKERLKALAGRLLALSNGSQPPIHRASRDTLSPWHIGYRNGKQDAYKWASQMVEEFIGTGEGQ